MHPILDPSIARREKRGGKRVDDVSTRRNVHDSTLVAVLLLATLAGIVLFGAVRVWSIGILLTALFVCGAFFLARPFFNQELRIFKIPPGLIPLSLFFIYVWAQSFFVAVRDDALFDALSVGGFAVAYFVWTGVAARVGRWRIVLGILLFAVTLVCWYTLIQHVHKSTGVLTLLRPSQYGMRASGTYMCPNHFANLLEMILCVCAGLLLLPASGAWLRILAGYTALISLPALFLTISRSGWLATCGGVALTTLLIVWRRSKKWFFILLIVIPVVVSALFTTIWFASPVARERLQGAMLSSPDSSVKIRFVMWKDSVNMIKDAPLIGHGGGSFRWVYPHYKSHDEQLWARYPHNEFVQAVTEYGVIGSLFLLVAGCIFVWKLVRVAFAEGRERDAALAAIALGAFGACLIHAVFDYNFHIYANVLTLALLAGVASSCIFASGSWAIRSCKGSAWWLPYVLLTAICIAGAFQSARMVLSYRYTQMGWKEAMAFRQEQAIEEYRRASVLDPLNWRPLLGIAGIYRGKAFWEMDAEMKKVFAQKALDEYDQALKLNPYEIETEYGKSTIYRTMGQGDAAMESLGKILDFSPNDAFILNKVGIQLRMNGDLDAAKEYFIQAKKLGGGRESELNLRLIRKESAAQ